MSLAAHVIPNDGNPTTTAYITPTAVATASNGSSSSGMSTNEIVGIVGAVVSILGGLFTVATMIQKRRDISSAHSNGMLLKALARRAICGLSYRSLCFIACFACVVSFGLSLYFDFVWFRGLDDLGYSCQWTFDCGGRIK
jgi:hypothetical protein